MTDEPTAVLRETDDDARRLARTLLRSAGYAAMAVIDPEAGFPAISRVLVGTDSDGVPVILVSGLSAHTRALDKDPRASLLVGEPGKGDPLAHPRLSVVCLAEKVARDTPHHQRLRTRFLARHAKAKLYIDLADFRFLRLVPQSASLIGGFARAYRLAGDELVIRSNLTDDLADIAKATVLDLMGRHPDLADRLAEARNLGKNQNWHIYGLDVAGFDMISGGKLLRYEFEKEITELRDLSSDLPKIAYRVP